MWVCCVTLVRAALALATCLGLASDLGLLVTGGSDFHGDPAHGVEPGSVTLRTDHYDRFCQARPDARA